MGDSETKRALKKYVDAATDLAEQVKRNIQKDGCIDDKTVLALNEFVISANEIADLTDQLNENESNRNYN